eukprot:tig00000042_g15452.t1
MTREIHQILGVKEVFQKSAKLVREAFGASRVRISSFDDTSLEAIDLAPTVPSSSVVLSTREIGEAPNVLPNHMMEQEGKIKDGYLAAMKFLALSGRRLWPICDVTDFTSFQGKPNGVIGVSQMDGPRRWDEAELRLFQTVSEQIGVAIAQSQLLSSEKEQRELLARQNAALDQARREADAASTAKSQFLAMVSHEIRTPMNALCNMSEFLLDTELSPQQYDFCSTMHSSSFALLNILNDILDTSRRVRPPS